MILFIVQCDDNVFQCSSGHVCLDQALVCDGNTHCYDKSDEDKCGKLISFSSQWGHTSQLTKMVKQNHKRNYTSPNL